MSLPVFGLAALLGFDLLPRIQNWHDLTFYRPEESTRYQHIDSLFRDEAVDWDLIETHWTDLLRTAISIRENRMSSVTPLRDLDDLATISPYITRTVRRFGNWTLNLTPPDDMPNRRLDLEPRVLFAAAPA